MDSMACACLVGATCGKERQHSPQAATSTPPSATHHVRLLNGGAFNADLPLAVSLLLLKGAWADLARQDLGADVVLPGQAQPHLNQWAAWTKTVILCGAAWRTVTWL